MEEVDVVVVVVPLLLLQDVEFPCHHHPLLLAREMKTTVEIRGYDRQAHSGL